MELKGALFLIQDLRLAQGEGVDSGLAVGVGVGDVVSTGLIGGVGVGGGGSGMGMMKRIILRTIIKLRTPKAIRLSLACDLREPRFTASSSCD